MQKKKLTTKSALILILVLTALLWIFAVPSGRVIGNVLAGLIMTIAIAAYWAT